MRRRRVRPEEDAQIDMTPMLDVVFIMLIFFIVTTSFVRESGVEVNRPKAASASEQKNAGVFIAVKENGEIYLDRKQLDVQKVHSVLERIIAERGEVGLVIQADELARHGVVVKVMDAAKSAGIKQISVAAEQP